MILNFPPAPASMVSSVSGGGILGGERDTRLASDTDTTTTASGDVKAADCEP
jgi:hypothetical protein